MRKPVKKKIITEPDYRYSSLTVAKLVNRVMQSGKKSTAEKIVYGALATLEKETKKPALEALDQVFDNAGPQVELRSRRVGGANYQVPIEVRGDRRLALAMRWIIESARKQKGKPMVEKLTLELLNAYNNTGTAIKKKQDTHRMAEANKAFAHFAW